MRQSIALLDEQTQGAGEVDWIAGELSVVAWRAEQLDVVSGVGPALGQRHDMVDVELLPNGPAAIGAGVLLKEQKPVYVGGSVAVGFAGFSPTCGLVFSALVRVLREPSLVPFVRCGLVPFIAFPRLLKHSLGMSGLVGFLGPALDLRTQCSRIGRVLSLACYAAAG